MLWWGAARVLLTSQPEAGGLPGVSAKRKLRSMGPTPGLCLALLFSPGVTSDQASQSSHLSHGTAPRYLEGGFPSPHHTRGLSSSQGHRPYTAQLLTWWWSSHSPLCSRLSLTHRLYLQWQPLGLKSLHPPIFYCTNSTSTPSSALSIAS